MWSNDNMKAIDLTAEQLDELDAYARTALPELRAAVLEVTRCIRQGARLAVIDADDAVTPSRAAKQLGMSRTHLYKLLDAGLIPSRHVGRDRRIRVHDLLDFLDRDR